MPLRKLQSALPSLIGRTIQHITVMQNDYDRSQLLLYFTDGTHYEFYAGACICGVRELQVGGREVWHRNGYIPTRGMLEVFDRETATITERPAPEVVAPAVVAAAVTASDAGGRLRRWFERGSK